MQLFCSCEVLQKNICIDVTLPVSLPIRGISTQVHNFNQQAHWHAWTPSRTIHQQENISMFGLLVKQPTMISVHHKPYRKSLLCRLIFKVINFDPSICASQSDVSAAAVPAQTNSLILTIDNPHSIRLAVYTEETTQVPIHSEKQHSMVKILIVTVKIGCYCFSTGFHTSIT